MKIKNSFLVSCTLLKNKQTEKSSKFMTPINALYHGHQMALWYNLESKQGAGGYIAHMSNICDSESRLQIHWRIQEGGGFRGLEPSLSYDFFLKLKILLKTIRYFFE